MTNMHEGDTNFDAKISACCDNLDVEKENREEIDATKNIGNIENIKVSENKEDGKNQSNRKDKKNEKKGSEESTTIKSAEKSVENKVIGNKKTIIASGTEKVPIEIMDISAEEDSEEHSAESSVIAVSVTKKAPLKRGRQSKAKSTKVAETARTSVSTTVNAKKSKTVASVEDTVAVTAAVSVAVDVSVGAGVSVDVVESVTDNSEMVVVPNSSSENKLDIINLGEISPEHTSNVVKESSSEVATECSLDVITIPDIAPTEEIKVLESVNNKRKRKQTTPAAPTGENKKTEKTDLESEVRSPEVILKIQCHQERMTIVCAELVALEK